MTTECLRIADQLHRALHGSAWHGASLSELLEGMTANQAQARPLADAHCVWELVLHIDAWIHAAAQAIDGIAMPQPMPDEINFPSTRGRSPQEWPADIKHLLESGNRLQSAIEKFSDDRLTAIVPGRKYDFYYLFHGIVQHSLYHGGQIALLRKAFPSHAQ